MAVSLVPQAFHPRVAKFCLEKGKYLMTSSYGSQAMRALDAQARARGRIFLNEVGLDPGIDHLEAMRIIHQFSWSPLGVLMASQNSARYLWDGREVILSADKLFDQPASLRLEGLGTLEGYPNRDLLSYLEMYGLSGAKTHAARHAPLPGLVPDAQTHQGVEPVRPTSLRAI